jgi:hypothetical protein
MKDREGSVERRQNFNISGGYCAELRKVFVE